MHKNSPLCEQIVEMLFDIHHCKQKKLIKFKQILFKLKRNVFYNCFMSRYECRISKAGKSIIINTSWTSKFRK